MRIRLAVIGPNPFDGRRVPFYRPPGPSAKLPPGTPEKKWAVYLIRRA